MTALDIYGDDCMNYYQNHLPNTYADLLGAYTATWRYQDGTLIPGDKISRSYVALDFIPGLDELTEDTEVDAGTEEAATGDDGEAAEDTADTAESDEGEADETDGAEGEDNAEGDSESTPEDDGETEGTEDSSENNDDDEEEQNNGETELVTDIGEGVDECSLPQWMCDLLRDGQA